MSWHRRQEPVWTSVRGAYVKAVSPAERGRSEATRLDVGEHTRTLFGLTMPPATTTSCGRPESSFRQFLALGNTNREARASTPLSRLTYRHQPLPDGANLEVT